MRVGGLGWMGLAALLAVALVWAARAQAELPQDGPFRFAAALSNIMTLERPDQDALATVWDGNKYVQCLRLPDRALRCEAAGARMQPSLGYVLVPERIKHLAELGWRLDPRFGNYVQTFSAAASTDQVAAQIVQTLGEVYAADLTHLEVASDWIAQEPCPPRNGPSQNLAGMINDAPAMAATAVHACAYTPDAADEAAPAALSAVSLVNLYGVRVSGELERLRVNFDREVFFALTTDTGYVQCQPEATDKTIYCEAASADSWSVLASVLTPERLARLHAAGFADPGRAPNYSKSYPASALNAPAVARELLTVLHDVYGYGGSPVLEITTEKGK